MCMGMCVDMCVGMCVDTCMGRCIDMSVAMYLPGSYSLGHKYIGHRCTRHDCIGPNLLRAGEGFEQTPNDAVGEVGRVEVLHFDDSFPVRAEDVAQVIVEELCGQMHVWKCGYKRDDLRLSWRR